MSCCASTHAILPFDIVLYAIGCDSFSQLTSTSRYAQVYMVVDWDYVISSFSYLPYGAERKCLQMLTQRAKTSNALFILHHCFPQIWHRH